MQCLRFSVCITTYSLKKIKAETKMFSILEKREDSTNISIYINFKYFSVTIPSRILSLLTAPFSHTHMGSRE